MRKIVLITIKEINFPDGSPIRGGWYGGYQFVHTIIEKIKKIGPYRRRGEKTKLKVLKTIMDSDLYL